MYELRIRFSLSKKKIQHAVKASDREHEQRTPEEQTIVQQFIDEVFAITKIVENIIEPLVDKESDWGEDLNPREIGWYLREAPDEAAIEIALEAAIGDKVASFDVSVDGDDDNEEWDKNEREAEAYSTKALAMPVLDRAGEVWKAGKRTITVISTRQDKNGNLWHKVKAVPPYLRPDKDGFNELHEDPLAPWDNNLSYVTPFTLVSKGPKRSN